MHHDRLGFVGPGADLAAEDLKPEAGDLTGEGQHQTPEFASQMTG